MPWVEVFAVFVVSHLAGDYLMQTERQATRKHGGLGSDPAARRALASHTVSYTLAFVPGLIWLGSQESAVTLMATALAIAIPHAMIDDGRLLRLWMARVKRTQVSPGTLAMMVDQSFHIVALFAVAVAVGS